MAGYSQLVIDFNRPRDDHTSVRVIGDSTVIPVNRRLPPMQLDARADVFFRPYHQAITDAIEARQYGTRCTVVISVHCYIDAAGLPKDTGSTLVSMISAKASAYHMLIS
ncbi:MAG: N-formylglutamate amidohydrolase [Pseudomonadota bacterium]|nr:N-formylglutamate amidohydrolase [Pseudomonadota bacterium]